MGTEYADLLQFVYQVPVGLVEADEAGHVRMVNPAAARMLAPVLEEGEDLVDLTPVLQRLCPELLTSLHEQPDTLGPVGVGRRFRSRTSILPELWVELLAVRVDLGRVMVVLVDVTSEQQLVRRERQQAFEVNDEIVQQIVAAETALDLGLLDRARTLVSAASDSGRRWIGEQLVLDGAGVRREQDLAPVGEEGRPR